ncbi:MAG: thiolase family protein [Acidimicrobiia bacterium]
MRDPVWLVGVAMTPFGRFPDHDLLDLASEAAVGALDDASLPITAVDVLVAGTVFRANESVGQQLLKQIGQTGIPVFNVANACATGATALRTANMAIAAGDAEIALAVGVEQMGKLGLLATELPRKGPAGIYAPEGRLGALAGTEGILGTETMPGVFAMAGLEYAHDHEGVGVEQFARVAEKNHAHSTLNPLSQYRRRFTLDEILTAPMISYPNTSLMCSPTADGAASAVLVSDERLRALPDPVRDRAIKISASVITTDPWSERGHALPDFNTLTRNAANQAYELAGVDPGDLDLVELHDCFATAELLHYDNLGLCAPGEAGRFLDTGAPWRDGATPVNVSGGLLSKGHPVGATGIAGVYEIATHLRGEAGARQIEGATIGLAHVLGLGTTCAVHILERAAR